MAGSSSSPKILPKLWQVFINFRGEELRNTFISHLVGALKLAGVNYYIDDKEIPSEDLSVLFTRIEQSEIALLIFSTKYADSEWCLDELVKIMEEVKKENLRIIPVFFNVRPEDVREQKGEFGRKLYADGKRKRPNIPKWEDALQSVTDTIGLDFANYKNEKELIDNIVESVKRVVAMIPSLSCSGMKQRGLEVKTESVGSISFENQQKGALKISQDSITNEDVRITPPQHQVFINVRAAELRHTFYSHLVRAMNSQKINVFIDEVEKDTSSRRIKESRVALPIFSYRYTESSWLLDELVLMKELMEQGKLRVIPVFYRLEPAAVRGLRGAFGENFRYLEMQYQIESERIKRWKEALITFSNCIGFTSDERSDEAVLIDSIIKSLKRVLIDISTNEIENSKMFGVERRIKQLQDILEFDHEQTRFIGVVGMPGMGKTTLAKMLYEKWQHKFESGMFFPDVSKMSKEYGLDWLQKSLMQVLLKDINPNIGYTENAHEVWKNDLLKRKVFIVLDDVSGKKQIKFLFGKRDWIKAGSKIVITSSDESLLRKLVQDIYVIPKLNSRDSLQYFTYHALGSDYAKGNYIQLSRHFLDFSKGNPLALKALGVELSGKGEAYWDRRIGTLTQNSNKMIEDVLRRRYDELTERQKEAFLDVACFFKSEDASYVRFLVDSCDSEITKAKSETKDLTDKFLVNISGHRVEMQDILWTFAKEQASYALANTARIQFRLLNHQDINFVMDNILGLKNVRGVFLDMSKVPEKLSFDANIFSSMCSLLYLRIYNSAFTQEGKDDLKIGVPKDLQLPLEKVRYLHWLKFPLEKLPSDFNVTNLVKLELPHSSITQVWEGFKDTPKLKWVDLSYSHKLNNLSGLSNAHSLERLNLEGCTSLVNLPQSMENMKSLIFLNMRSCKHLRFFPTMKLGSLKVLILSDCSELQKYELISETLEALYLDGTALKGLSPAIGDLECLAILNLRGCKMLESLPECLGKQKSLEELILSGCSKLESVPKDVESMKYLRILLLDGTRIKEMPKIYSLQRLCLSRNNAMVHLQGNMSGFYHLKWLDLRNCENLEYLPTLPPNLEFFDAHGCERLEAVTNPLSSPTTTEQIRSTFFFTNCKNLEQDARDIISSYAQWKCHRLALECYDRGVVSGALFNLCYPGFEVPTWFQHQAVGSILEPKLQPHWCNNRLSGMALCALVSFDSNQDPINIFIVKCKIQFEKEDGSHISLDCDVGSLTKPVRIESDHVFIGYGSCSHIIKRLEDEFSGSSIPTKASLEFYGSDAYKSEVVNCGLSLVYAEQENKPVKPKHYKTSSERGGSWVEDLLTNTFLAAVCVVLVAPQYYLRIYNYLWPLLVCFFCLVALGWFMEWKERKPKQEKGSGAHGTG